MIDLFNRRKVKDLRAELVHQIYENRYLRRKVDEARTKVAGLQPHLVAGLRRQNDEQADMIRRLREEASKFHNRPMARAGSLEAAEALIEHQRARQAYMQTDEYKNQDILERIPEKHL